jgi:hypothetical protein
MIKVILRLGCFFGFNLLMLILFLGIQNVSGTERKNNETESNLLITPKYKHYDYVFLGTSHGRTFSRYGNHQRIESILESTVLNLSLGSGGGVLPALTSLEYFVRRGNSATTLVYFLDPWVLYYRKYNENHVFVHNEPLSGQFALLLLKNGFDKIRLLEYIRTKYQSTWRHQSPDLTIADTSVVKWSDSLANLTMKGRSPGPLDTNQFRIYCKTLRQIFEIAKSQNMKIKVVIPPTLIGETPGHREMVKELEVLQSQIGVSFVDHTSVINQVGLFSDHDHLNTQGIVTYTTDYLKPFLR